MGNGNFGDIFPFYSFKVFISGTKSECRKVLETILKNRRLCSLLSPFFTPNAAPAEFIQLYEKVVKLLSEDNSDIIFMLLTKVRYDPVLMLPLKCRNAGCRPRHRDERLSGVLFPGRPQTHRPLAHFSWSLSSLIPQLPLVGVSIVL